MTATTDDKTRQALLRRVTTALRDGTLELPSLPDIALEVRVAASSPNTGLDDLAKIVRQDPGLTAYLLKISNSSLYARAHPATNLTMALNRLGLIAARDLASSYAIRTLFFIKDPAIKQLMRDVWQRAVYSASIANFMAQHGGFDPEKALLAALLQDIGALPVLAELKHFPQLLSKRRVIDELLEEFVGKISGVILNAWNFGQEFVVVGLQRENWYRDSGPKPDLADLVLVARYHTYLGKPHPKLPPLVELPAFHKLELGQLGPEHGLQIVREAREEIEQLRALLA